jgi:hypothetical protein
MVLLLSDHSMDGHRPSSLIKVITTNCGGVLLNAIANTLERRDHLVFGLSFVWLGAHSFSLNPVLG